MKKKKILFLVLSLEVGGLEKMVIDLAKGMSKHYDIVLCCLENKGSLINEMDEYISDLIVLDKKPGIQLGLVLKIAKIIIKYNISIVHTHNSGPHFYGALSSFVMPGCKLVHTKHGRNKPDDKGRVLLNRIASILSDRVVTVSEDARKLAVEFEKSPANKTVMIENGVDLEPYLSAAECSFPEFNSDSINIIHVGRLSQEKGQDTLLNTMYLFLNKYPTSKLHIVGDGPERQSLEKISQELNLSEAVKFYGNRSDVSLLLKQADWFALTSHTEGMPIAVIEALASSLPIISTDVGGLSEMITNGENGFLIEGRDASDICDAWLKLAADVELLKVMGENARNTAINKYNLSSMIDKYRKVYRELGC